MGSKERVLQNINKKKEDLMPRQKRKNIMGETVSLVQFNLVKDHLMLVDHPIDLLTDLHTAPVKNLVRVKARITPTTLKQRQHKLKKIIKNF